MKNKIIGFISLAAIITDIWIAAYFFDAFDDWRKIPVFLTAMIVFMLSVIFAIIHFDNGAKTEWKCPR